MGLGLFSFASPSVPLCLCGENKGDEIEPQRHRGTEKKREWDWVCSRSIPLCVSVVKKRDALLEMSVLGAWMWEGDGCMDMNGADYLSKNRQAWDGRVRENGRHTCVVKPEHLGDPLPILDPERWLGNSLRGRSVLCLAAGGGLQSALCAAAGADVTVVDLSPEMLRRDQEVARRHGLRIRVVEAEMTRLETLGSESFDFVIQPVSTCYVPDVRPLYAEVARVLKSGGIYVSQHKQPTSQQASATPAKDGYFLSEPCEEGRLLPPVLGEWRHRESDAVEFIHRWEDLIGSLCRAGFVVEDLMEPIEGDKLAPVGSFEHRSGFAPPFVKIKARRNPRAPGSPASSLWVP